MSEFDVIKSELGGLSKLMDERTNNICKKMERYIEDQTKINNQLIELTQRNSISVARMEQKIHDHERIHENFKDEIKLETRKVAGTTGGLAGGGFGSLIWLVIEELFR